MTKKSYIKELLIRRIPQIIGSYFVASTSMILFLDWLKINYALPEEYITLALFGALSILPSVIILAYFHGAPGKDEWTKIEKIGIPINVIFIFSILVFGYKGNWWFNKVPNVPTTKVELNADKTRIFIPYFGSRNELLILMNHEVPISHIIKKYGQGDENPNDYKITPLNNVELNELYDELITRVNTSFFPDNIIYTYEDVVKAYEEIAQIPPDFKTFPTMIEGFLLEDSLKGKMYKPFKGFVADTLSKIMNQIDNNEYANQLLISLNIFKIEPTIGNIEKVGAGDIIFRKVYDIRRNNTTNQIEKSVKTSSTLEGIHASNVRLIPDIVNLINRINKKFSYDEFVADIESVKGDKVFIKMKENNPLLKNTELSVMRQYIFQEEESVKRRIRHIEKFMECCEINPVDADCKNFRNLHIWSKEEYDKLITEQHELQLGQGKNQIGLNKIILVEEVYDSIAVGKIIENANTCIELLPGDLLKLNK